METVEQLIHSQNKLGEGPIWDVNTKTLYWVDIHNQTVEKYSPITNQHKTYHLNLSITVLGLRAKNGFVFASDKGFGFWDEQLNHIQIIENPEAGKPYHRFNDGAVGPGGRFWAGTMYEGPEQEKHSEGCLYCLNQDGSIRLMEKGLTISNGIGWNKDASTMYLTDTLRRVIYQYDFDIKKGVIENRRIFFTAEKDDGYPDGITVDSMGFIWVAFFGGGKVCRLDPEGKIERVIELPVQYPTSVTFGGLELNELFITSSWMSIPPQERIQHPMAGDVFRLNCDVKGKPEYIFKG